MILVNARVMAAAWIARGAAVLKTLGPYVALGLLLPGRSLIALLRWLSRHRHRGSGRRLAMRHPMRLMSRDWSRMLLLSPTAALASGCTAGHNLSPPRRSATRAPSPLPVMKQSLLTAAASPATGFGCLARMRSISMNPAYTDHTHRFAVSLGSLPDAPAALASIFQSAVPQATLLSCLDDFKVLRPAVPRHTAPPAPGDAGPGRRAARRHALTRDARWPPRPPRFSQPPARPADCGAMRTASRPRSDGKSA
jgi:hypothetical protein